MEPRVWLSVPNSPATQYLHGIESLAFNGDYFIFLFNYIYNSKLKRVILNFDWRSLELCMIGFLINSISRIQDFVLFYLFFVLFWVNVRTTMMKGFAQQTTTVCHKSSPSMTSLDPVLFAMGRASVGRVKHSKMGLVG